jgi:hypothetical protein
MKKLDIDRLHTVTQQILTGEAGNNVKRGDGRTTAYLYLMLGEVDGGDYGNDYMYVGYNLEKTMQKFVEILLEAGYPCSIEGPTINVPTTDQSFLFVLNTYSQLQLVFNGPLKFNRVFNDCLYNSFLHSDIKLDDILKRQGDLI